MSEIGLNINVDSYNNEGIKTIKDNNNAEIYKLYILKNKRRLSLVGKNVKLGYVMAGTTKGDVIENLNITNAEQGEITFPITNRISKQDGVYSCQLAIYGADGFLEHTATFGLTVEANIFTKIAGEIENSKDLTYIERILEEAKTVSGELKTNIPVATNLNSSLESNISSASNINTTLADTTEKSKVAATDAIEKKSQLEKSITKAKEFIEGLDGSQNIPQIRMDVTELQNGLKSNQALSYEGSSISAENTLEGRTTDMVVKGRTLINMVKLGSVSNVIGIAYDTLAIYSYMYNLKNDTDYTIIFEIENKTDNNQVRISLNNGNKGQGFDVKNGINIIKIRSNAEKNNKLMFYYGSEYSGNGTVKNVILLEGDWTNKPIPSYFEGIKSFGQQEDKISILSNGKNLFNHDELTNGEIVTFNNKRCFKYKDDATNFTLDIKGEENKQYTISIKMYRDESQETKRLNIQFVYSDGTFKTYNLDHDTLREFTTESAKTLAKIKGAYNHSLNAYIDLECTQLEEGSIKTTYEPYKQDKKDILIKEPLREGDYLYEDNGQVKINRYVKEYTFTGDERTTKENTLINITRFYIDTQCKNKVNTRNIICNNFNSNGTWWDRDEIGMYWDTSIQGRLWFHIPKTKFNDVESFRNFLKANPTTIVYQLATPVTEVVENCVDIDLDTFQDKTYFSIENSLPGTLDFKVPSNIASVVQNTAKEVNNIWDVINNLLVPSLIDINKNVALATIKNNLK